MSFFKKGDFWDLTDGDPATPVMHLTKPHHLFPWDRPFFTFLVLGRCVEHTVRQVRERIWTYCNRNLGFLQCVTRSNFIIIVCVSPSYNKMVIRVQSILNLPVTKASLYIAVVICPGSGRQIGQILLLNITFSVSFIIAISSSYALSRPT